MIYVIFDRMQMDRWMGHTLTSEWDPAAPTTAAAAIAAAAVWS